jgi:hypothetical protein
LVFVLPTNVQPTNVALAWFPSTHIAPPPPPYAPATVLLVNVVFSTIKAALLREMAPPAEDCGPVALLLMKEQV